MESESESPYLIKVLYIEQVSDTAQRVSELEAGCGSHLLQKEKGAVVDFTVVRDCVSGFELIAHIMFDVIMIHQRIKFVSGVEMLKALEDFGYKIPVVFIADKQFTKGELESLAKRLGYFDVLSDSSDFETFSGVLFNAFQESRGKSCLSDQRMPDMYRTSSYALQLTQNKCDRFTDDCRHDEFKPGASDKSSTGSAFEGDEDDDWSRISVHEI